MVINNLNQGAFIYRNEADSKIGNHYLQVKLIGGGLNVVGSGAGELEVAGNITASGDISSSYTSTGSIGILELHGGVIDLKNAGTASQIKFYCESLERRT